MSEPAAPTAPKRDLWTLVLFSVLLLLGLATLGLGVYLAVDRGEFTVLALGVLAVMIPAAAARLAAAGGSATAGEMAEQTRTLCTIAERVQMSELERRMVDRQRDRQSLRNAIESDVQQGDYEAALALIDEMAEQFGYVEEAEAFRQRIIDARAREREETVNQAVREVDALCARYDWDAAGREVDRLMRLLSDDPRIASLPRRIQRAREEHKRELEREFLRVAEIGDTDKAMELLKELDRYLTPQEAEAYRETARGVIGQARENTAVRFRMAVSDRDWIEAMNVGEQIIREFPNSKMADEVRDMMDVLRERAAGQRSADTGRVA